MDVSNKIKPKCLHFGYATSIPNNGHFFETWREEQQQQGRKEGRKEGRKKERKEVAWCTQPKLIDSRIPLI